MAPLQQKDFRLPADALSLSVYTSDLKEFDLHLNPSDASLPLAGMSMGQFLDLDNEGIQQLSEESVHLPYLMLMAECLKMDHFLIHFDGSLHNYNRTIGLFDKIGIDFKSKTCTIISPNRLSKSMMAREQQLIKKMNEVFQKVQFAKFNFSLPEEFLDYCDVHSCAFWLAPKKKRLSIMKAIKKKGDCGELKADLSVIL
ncbi:MAG: hypothetical protein LAT68_01360 [Cyclobacteriaceae bacterium]|nr:hypothetical protein [Cyclobacteriaceae bacterium]MCH8514951.1 hypothetical protein [Cyclobacteriaceae bacterium]